MDRSEEECTELAAWRSRMRISSIHPCHFYPFVDSSAGVCICGSPFRVAYPTCLTPEATREGKHAMG